MLSAAASASLTYTQTDIYTSATTPIAEYANNINVLNMRNKNTLEALGEIGFGYRFRNFEVCLFVRDFRGLTSLTNSAHRFDNPLLIDYFYYIDDKVVLNKYELGATISFTLKNTVKKR